MRFLQRKSDLGIAVLIGGLCALMIVSAATAEAASSRLSPIMKYMLNGGNPPGKPLPPGEAPKWMHTPLIREATVVATKGAHRLITYRVLTGADENICFVVDDHLDSCGFATEWEATLANNPAPWYLWGLYGDAPAEHRKVLHGIVDRTITTVRVEYPNATSHIVSPAASGALIIPFSLNRCPERIVGLDSGGKPVVREDMASLLKRSGPSARSEHHGANKPSPCAHAKKKAGPRKHRRSGAEAETSVVKNGGVAANGSWR